MVSLGLYSREELLKRLAPYKASFEGDISITGVELWKLGWGRVFTMRRESNGLYDEAQYRAALDLIAATIPYDWHDKNGR